MANERRKRPKLERDQPIRSFSSMFDGGAQSEAPASSSRPSSSSDEPASVVSSAVDLGYRVIEAYMRQGQEAARMFTGNPSRSPGAPGEPGEPMQQMTQRMMQYGWDFAGMWFEMWSKMAEGGIADGGWPGMPRPPEPQSPAQPASAAPGAPHRERVSVVVKSALPTETALDLRPVPGGKLVIHALRAEGHDGAAMHGVQIDCDAEAGAVVVRVEVPADQAAGLYNAMILDAASNMPRGTLSVMVSPRD